LLVTQGDNKLPKYLRINHQYFAYCVLAKTLVLQGFYPFFINLYSYLLLSTIETLCQSGFGCGASQHHRHWQWSSGARKLVSGGYCPASTLEPQNLLPKAGGSDCVAGRTMQMPFAGLYSPLVAFFRLQGWGCMTATLSASAGSLAAKFRIRDRVAGGCGTCSS
jgi:hypothetical protein